MQLTEEKLKELIKTASLEAANEVADEKVKAVIEKEKDKKKDAPPIAGDGTEVITGEDNAAKKPFKSFGEYLSKVKFASANPGLAERWDPRLYPFFTGKFMSEVKTAGHLAESEDSQGGFLVPEEFLTSLYSLALEESVIRPNGPTVLTMRTDTLNIPRVNDTTHASTVYGGVYTYWTEEAVTKEATKPTFGQCKLQAHKLCGLTNVSNELMADSAIALDGLLRQMFGRAIAYEEDYTFLQGNGVGQPLGIMNCACKVLATKTAASHFYSFDIANMWARLLPSSQSRAIWIMNQANIPELLEMSDIGAAPAAGTNLVWMDRYTNAPIWRILGRPIFFTEKLPTLGTTGSVILADLSYYLIGDRQSVTIDTSTHVAFKEDETVWRFVLRVDGQCWPSSALTPKDGGDTLSPFVVLNYA